MKRATALLVGVAAAFVGLAGCASDASFRRAATEDEREAGDRLAAEMVESLGGMEAWGEVEVISFIFVTEAGVEVVRNAHAWDKERGLHGFQQGDLVVYTDLWAEPGSDERGVVLEDGQAVSDPEERADALEAARQAFINDGYWLLAPFKVFEEGVHRAAIDGDLRLTFDDGVGITSGDAYLFELDESGRPVSWSFDLESGLKGSFPFEGPVEEEGLTFFTERPSGLGLRIRFKDVEVSTGPRPELFGPLADRR